MIELLKHILQSGWISFYWHENLPMIAGSAIGRLCSLQFGKIFLHWDGEIEVEACKYQHEQQYTAADEPEEDFQDFFKHFPDALRLNASSPYTHTKTYLF